jgi:bifunctional non-homologous end joining protein LigD
MRLPYAERRDILANLGIERGCCRVPPGHIGQVQAMLETAADYGLEGIIAKRLDSIYEPGRRSPIGASSRPPAVRLL